MQPHQGRAKTNKLYVTKNKFHNVFNRAPIKIKVNKNINRLVRYPTCVVMMLKFWIHALTHFSGFKNKFPGTHGIRARNLVEAWKEIVNTRRNVVSTVHQGNKSQIVLIPPLFLCAIWHSLSTGWAGLQLDRNLLLKLQKKPVVVISS